MKENTKRRLSELILEELSEKIRSEEGLRQKLEAFTDLPVEKVAEAMIKQFEYLLSSDLRDLIIHMIEQDVQAEEDSAAAEIEREDEEPVEEVPQPRIVSIEDRSARAKPADEFLKDVPELDYSAESIMEHFRPKEPFPSEPMDIPLGPDDWYYLYGFSYAPDSTGKGIPTRKLALKGVDGTASIFMIDYGDVRFYAHKMNSADYSLDKRGRPTLNAQGTIDLKYNHEKILNVLRSEDVLVPLPFWTILQGHQNIITAIEDRYVDLLRALIDVHDIVEWEVDVLTFDDFLLHLPAVVEDSKPRMTHRDTKHPAVKGRDIKLTEKVIFREKNFAQEIHNELLLHALKAKVDYMIRLDSAIMNDWKSILSARYTITKDKRRTFCQTIAHLQDQFSSFRLMFRMTNPSNRFILFS